MGPHTLSFAAINFAPLGLIFAAFIGALPAIAAFVAIIWYIILIWESATLRDWRANRARHRLAKVKAKEQALLGFLKKVDAETPEDRSESPISDELKGGAQPEHAQR